MDRKQHPVGTCSRRRVPLLSGLGGVCLEDNDISPLDGEPGRLTADCIPAEVASHSIDPASAERLWALSERLLDA